MQIIYVTFFAVLAALSINASVLKDDNLFSGGDFPPVVLDGVQAGANGWQIFDCARYAHNCDKKKPDYLRGDKCFKLEFFTGGMSIKFVKDLYKISDHYKTKSFLLYNSNIGMLMPPASSWRLTGEIKTTKGSIRVLKKTFKPSADWQKFNITLSSFSRTAIVVFHAVPGGEYAFRNFKLTTEYRDANGTIALPNDGKLSKIVIPKKNDLMLRTAALLWRGWLWRLSGVALPIETVATPRPENGALVIMPGKTSPGGFKLKIDSKGGVLKYTRTYAVRSALFEYLRSYGCRFFALDNQVVPATNRNIILKQTDVTVNPKFNYIDMSTSTSVAFPVLANGGVGSMKVQAGQTGDWYEMPSWGSEHAARFLLPFGLYGKSHPEYYALKKDGKRWNSKFVFDLHLCTSNPEVRKKTAARLLDWIRSQPDKLDFQVTSGDGCTRGTCFCPGCNALDPNLKDESRTDVYLDFLNYIAREVAKKFPDVKIYTYAYTKIYDDPPLEVKPEKNVVIMYCPWASDFKCPAHIDCEFNHIAVKNVEKWGKTLGRENLAFCAYDALPYYLIRQMKLFNKNGNSHLYLGIQNPLLGYLVNRWNMGDNVETAMGEICLAYFGKGGPFIRRAFKTLDEYALNYKHSREDTRANFISLLGNVMNRKSVIDRATFDKLYKLYDEALTAVDNNKVFRKRILYEKLKVMRTDISTYSRGTCKNKNSLTAFANRVADFIRTTSELLAICGNEYPYRLFKTEIGYSCSVRDYFNTYVGLEIGDSKAKDWTHEAEVVKFLKAPVATLAAGTEKIPGGWLWKPVALLGGTGNIKYSYMCPPKITNAIRRPSSKQHKITAELTLEKDIPEQCILRIEGQDDEKPGRALWEVRVNGKILYSGANTFAEKGWSNVAFPVPAGTLKVGNNIIELENKTPDKSAGKVVAAYYNGVFMGDERRQDYSWGWICISEISLHNINRSNMELTTWTNTKAKAGAGKQEGACFEQQGRYVYYTKFIPVDVTKIYKLSGWVKNPTGKELGVLFGIKPYDKGKKWIREDSVVFKPGTDTELAADCLATDTVIKVKDVSNWKPGKMELIAFKAQTDKKDLPNRNLSSLGIEKIEKKEGYGEITLKGAARYALPIGTLVRQHKLISPKWYTSIAKVPPGSDWIELKGRPFKKWYPGTAYCKIIIVGGTGLLFDKMKLEIVK